MSSITMPADSTQSDQKMKKKQSKRKKHRSYSTTSSSSDDSHDSPVTKKLKKKASKEAKTNSSDSNCESDLDLSKELLTISGYMNDKEAMIENMFKSISSKKMKTMLPEILQPLSLKELKGLCLEQLHIMSSKRINKILAGDDPETISSSASDEGETEADEQLCKRADGKSKTIPSKQEETDEKSKASESCQDFSKAMNKDGNLSKLPSKPLKEIASIKNIEQRVDDHRTIKQTTKVGDTELGTSCKEKGVDASLKKCETSSNITNIDPGNNNNNSRNTEDDVAASEENYDQKRKVLIEEKHKIEKVGGSSKSQLEILELEMRARAIKAMLKAQDEQERQMKRRSCEAGVESHESRFDDRRPQRVRHVEHSEKEMTSRTSRTRSNRSHASASFEDRSNYWETHPGEGHTKRHWEDHGHQREPDRYNKWRDRYRNW